MQFWGGCMRRLATLAVFLFVTIVVFVLLAGAPAVNAESDRVTSDHTQPRQVPKTGDVEIPPGMHLVRDRAGLRWLLPVGMEKPPEREVEIRYFKTREAPSRKGRIGSHEVLSGPVSAESTVVTTDVSDSQSLMKRLPKAFAEVMYLEKAANLHALTSNDLKSLGVFAPAEFTTFKVPYIPIPVSEMEFSHLSDYARGDTKSLVQFEKGGRKYVRFFVHPNYVSAYADLIERHGIVYHYDAMTTSSPRSLIVMDAEKPGEVHWVKVSIHKEIDGSVRINTDKKARRAIIMSEAIESVPSDQMKRYGVQFMLEPAALQPKGKIASTIFREVDPELLNPGRGYRWIPAFILQNTGENAVEGLNIKDMAVLAGERPMDFVQERIVRPLLRSYLGMGLVEGLPGELHTQNFYYRLKKVNGGWLPTGEVMFKDNDGFRFDTELAVRQSRKLARFAAFPDPFTWGKFSNALGLGAEGVAFLGSWYYKLIRNVNGFETLAAYLLRAINEIDPRARLDKDGIQRVFDRIAAEEAEKITGIRLAEADFGFGQDKGLNKILGEWRTKLALLADGPEARAQREDVRLQSLLAAEWSRLKSESRVSPLRRTLSQAAHFQLMRLVDGALIIEARTPKTTAANPDPVIGFALLEAPNTQEGRRAEQRLGRYAFAAPELGSALVARSPAANVIEFFSPSVTKLRSLSVSGRCEAMFVPATAAGGN